MAYVDMYIPSMAGTSVSVVGASHILREASASLSVLLRWAIPEPPFAEWAASTALTLFVLLLSLVSGYQSACYSCHFILSIHFHYFP